MTDPRSSSTPVEDAVYTKQKAIAKHNTLVLEDNNFPSDSNHKNKFLSIAQAVLGSYPISGVAIAVAITEEGVDISAVTRDTPLAAFFLKSATHSIPTAADQTQGALPTIRANISNATAVHTHFRNQMFKVDFSQFIDFLIRDYETCDKQLQIDTSKMFLTAGKFPERNLETLKLSKFMDENEILSLSDGITE
eukprot:IDg9115t1